MKCICRNGVKRFDGLAGSLWTAVKAKAHHRFPSKTPAHPKSRVHSPKAAMLAALQGVPSESVFLTPREGRNAFAHRIGKNMTQWLSPLLRMSANGLRTSCEICEKCELVPSMSAHWRCATKKCFTSLTSAASSANDVISSPTSSTPPPKPSATPSAPASTSPTANSVPSPPSTPSATI